MRDRFVQELDQLGLQVEVMAARVDEQMQRMAKVLLTGDADIAAEALASDDAIDAMNVSLTERCYQLLVLEAPVASDLRFVVSVLRVLGELERIGDLLLRVVKLAPEQPMLAEEPGLLGTLCEMEAAAADLFRKAVRAWEARDLEAATELAGRTHALDTTGVRLTVQIMALDGPHAVATAVVATLAGRAIERIADHAVIIGARLRYLITGDPAHLVAEIR
jgi:phosphate transport system protein